MEPVAFVTATASADGYGNAGEHLALSAVGDHAADMAVYPLDWRDERFCSPAFMALLRGEFVHGHDTVVVHHIPWNCNRFRGTRLTVSQTMWETDRAPDNWVSYVTAWAGAMIVPSAHCRDVFAGRVDVPIEVVPYGTDTDLYTYTERDPTQPGCRFLMTGLLHYRKGVEFALRALREEFTDGEDVELWLKTRLTFLDAGSEWATLGDPRVSILDDDRTRAGMRDLYHRADCLLAPSRGEGSGLTPRDAMATGLPVILTDWSGLSELADPGYAFPVGIEGLVEVPADNTSYGEGVVGSGPIGRMARPSVADIRAAMRSVYEDRAGAFRRGRAAADWMRAEWTWSHCSAKWLAAIERLGAAVPA